MLSLSFNQYIVTYLLTYLLTSAHLLLSVNLGYTNGIIIILLLLLTCLTSCTLCACNISLPTSSTYQPWTPAVLQWCSII